MFLRIIDNLMNRIQHKIHSFKVNSLGYQKTHWEQALAEHDWSSSQMYGYQWGDPDNPEDRLGNYLAVKTKLLSCITLETTVLEIGSLGGKWTQFLVSAKEIICADINDLGFKYIRQKLPKANIRFYLTKGNELMGIEDNSVDVVFSMDSLVRTSKKNIQDYFKESYRVLKPGGRIYMHLPCTIKPESLRRGFVKLSLKEIQQYGNRAGFRDVSIDTDLIHHGVMVEGVKGTCCSGKSSCKGDHFSDA